MCGKAEESLNKSCVQRMQQVSSSGNVCYLAHFFIACKEIRKNLYLEIFSLF